MKLLLNAVHESVAMLQQNSRKATLEKRLSKVLKIERQDEGRPRPSFRRTGGHFGLGRESNQERIGVLESIGNLLVRQLSTESRQESLT